jgi:hypothetical protein
MILAALSTVVPRRTVVLFLKYCEHVSRGSLNDHSTSALAAPRIGGYARRSYKCH